MKIRIEISSLATNTLSGVNFYVKRLTESLDQVPDTEVTGSYFNFLNRQPTPSITLKKPLDKNSLIPLRVYAKFQSHQFIFPFDIFKPKVDLTIQPNFALWPTINSRINAVVIHDLTYINFPEVVEKNNLPHLQRIVPRAIRKADFVITVSETVKAEIVSHFSLDPKKCLVTTVPPEPFYGVKNTNEIHKKYHIPTTKYIFFISNLEPRKNIPTLVKAYRELPNAIKDEYSLVLAGGKGWKSDTAQAAIQKAQDANEKVIHVGYIDQKDSPAFFQKASAFVMPSLYEGFGMPALEAMIAKTPVVLSDIPVHHEVGGDAVLYADPNNSLSFRDALVKILKDTSLANSMIEKGMTQLKQFSWEKNAQTIINYTNQLLADKK